MKQFTVIYLVVLTLILSGCGGAAPTPAPKAETTG